MAGVKGRSGRNRTPTALQLLKGTHRGDRRDEPQPEIGVEMPDDLSPEARKQWPKVVAQLEKVGVLTKMDEMALVFYCETYATWERAMKKVRTHGTVIAKRSGDLHMNPELSVANHAFDRLLRMLQEFGMTPASRSAVKVVKRPVSGPGASGNRFAAIRAMGAETGEQ